VLKVEIDPKVSGAERYRVLEESLIALLEGEPDALANLANAAETVMCPSFPENIPFLRALDVDTT